MNILEIHLTVLTITAITILYSDHLAYQYFRGTRSILEKKTVHILHRIVSIGLLGMIVSGILLFIPLKEYLLTEAPFYIKMTFVVTLIINAWFIGRVSHTACERPFSELTQKEQKTLIISGIISVSGWVGAAIIGFFFL